MGTDLRRLIERLRRLVSSGGPLRHALLKVSSGVLLAQVVTLSVYPVLTRFYSEAAFGALSVYSSTVGIITTVSTLRYERSIPLPEKDKSAFTLLCLALGLNILAAALFLAFFLINPAALAVLGVADSARFFVVMAGLGVVFTGTYGALTMWAVRMRSYAAIAKTKVSRSIGTAALNLLGAFVYPTPAALIGGNMLGSGLGSWTIWRETVRGASVRRPTLRELRRAGGEYWPHAITNSPASVITSVATHLPAPVISFFFGFAAAGQFGLAMAMIGAPMHLIGNSVQSVFYGEASAIGKSQPRRIKALLDGLTKRISLILIVPAVILAVFSPQLFSFVFGSQWSLAGEMTRFLVLYMVMNILSVPFVSVFLIFDRLRLYLALTLVKLVAAVAALVIPGFLGMSEIMVIACYSFALATYYAIFGFCARRIVVRATLGL